MFLFSLRKISLILLISTITVLTTLSVGSHVQAAEFFVSRNHCDVKIRPFDPTQTNPSAPGNIPLRNTYTRLMTASECQEHVRSNEAMPYTIVPFEEQKYQNGSNDYSGLKDSAHIYLPEAGKDKHLPWGVHNYYYYSDTQEDENVYLTLLSKARIDFAPDFQQNVEQVDCYAPYPQYDFEKKDQNLPSQAAVDAALEKCNGYIANLWGGTRVAKDTQGVTWEFGVDNPLLAPRLYNKGATLQSILGVNFDSDLYTEGSNRGKRVYIDFKTKKINSPTGKWSATTFSKGLMKTYGIKKENMKSLADFNARYQDFCTTPGDFSKWCPAVMNRTDKQAEQFRGAEWLWSFGGRLADVWMDSRTNPPAFTVNPFCTNDKLIDSELSWKNCGTNPNELQVVKRVNGVCTTDIIFRKTVDSTAGGTLKSFGFSPFNLKTDDYCVKLRDGDAMCTAPKPLSTDALKTSCVHPDGEVTTNPFCTTDKLIDADVSWKNCGTGKNEIQITNRVNGVCSTDIIYRKEVDTTGAGKLSSFGFAPFDLKSKDYCFKLRDGDAMCTTPKPLSTDALKTSCVHPDPVATFTASAPMCTKDDKNNNTGLWSTEASWENCSTSATAKAQLIVAPYKNGTCVYTEQRKYEVNAMTGKQAITGLTDNTQYCVRMMEGAKICTDGVIAPTTAGTLCQMTTPELRITKERSGGTQAETDFTLTLTGTAVTPQNDIHASRQTAYVTPLLAAGGTYTVDEVQYADYIKTFRGECTNITVPANPTQGKVCTVVNTYKPFIIDNACIQGTVNDRVLTWDVASAANWEVQVSTDPTFATIAHRQDSPVGVQTLRVTGYAFQPNVNYSFRFYDKGAQRVISEVRTTSFPSCVDTKLQLTIGANVCVNNVQAPAEVTISAALAGSLVTIAKQPNGPTYTVQPSLGETRIGFARFQNVSSTTTQAFVPETGVTYIVRHQAPSMTEATATFTPGTCTTPPGTGGSSSSFVPSLSCDVTTKAGNMTFGWSSCRNDGMIELVPDGDNNGKCEDTDFCIENKWDAAGTKCLARPAGYVEKAIGSTSSSGLTSAPTLANLFPGYTLESGKNYCTRIKSPGLQDEICDGTKYLPVVSACGTPPTSGGGGGGGSGGGTSTVIPLGQNASLCKGCGCLTVLSSPRVVGDYQKVTLTAIVSNRTTSKVKDGVKLIAENIVRDSFDQQGAKGNNLTEGAVQIDSVAAEEADVTIDTMENMTIKSAATSTKVIYGDTKQAVQGNTQLKGADKSQLKDIFIPTELLPPLASLTDKPSKVVRLTIVAKVRHSDITDKPFTPGTSFVNVTYAMSTEGQVDSSSTTTVPTKNTDSTRFTISRPFIMTYNGGDVLLTTGLNGLANAKHLYSQFGITLRDIIGEVFTDKSAAVESPFVTAPISISETNLKKALSTIGTGGTQCAGDRLVQGSIKNMFSGCGVSPKSDGTLLYHVANDLHLSGISDLVGERATVIIDGNLYVKGNVSYGAPTAGQALPSLAFIVKGKIYIDPVVTRMDGVYIASEVQPTGTWKLYYETKAPLQLVVNGGLFATLSPEFIASRPYVGPDPLKNPASIKLNYDGRILSATPPGLKEILGGSLDRLKY